MRLTMKIIIASVLTVLIGLKAYGETPADSVKVYFRVGHRQFDPAFGNNRAVMDSFVNVTRKANIEGNISRLTVSAFASPDGASDANERLARMRCDAIADYVSEHTGVSRNFIETYPGGIAWGELLRMVEENPEVPSRAIVLDILANVPVWIYNSSGAIVDGRKKRLMELDHGMTYRWMLSNLFPELRNAVAVTVFYHHLEADEYSLNTADNSKDAALNSLDATHNSIEESENSIEFSGDYAGEEIIPDSESMHMTGGSENAFTSNDQNRSHKTAYGEGKPFYMDIRSNLLYDALLVPNLGAEFYVGKHLSVYGEWMYAWWDNENTHRSWRIYGGDLGVRWWFGRKAHSKPLTGHHLGVYYGILTFDFATGENGYLGGKPNGTLWDRWLINTGIEYGYSLPVAKRLNIDFSIGLGYMGGNYIKYFPFDNDYYRDKEYKMHFFGPTKAEISLVWLIGRGNTNNRKGGGK